MEPLWGIYSQRTNKLARFKYMRVAICLVGSVIGGSPLFVSSRLAIAAEPPPQASGSLDVQTIHYPSGDATIEAYLARPKSSGKHPAILLIHDDHGLTQGTQELARQFAQSGFVALAPNLLSHPGTAKFAGPGDGYALRLPVNVLPADQTVDDVTAAFAYLKQDADVDAAKISAIGIGWGGWRTFKLAENGASLYRLVVFYGVTPDDGQVDTIKAPVLAHYAQGDFLITASSLKTKKWLGQKFTYYIYPNTDHGFFAGGSGGIDVVAMSGEVDLDAAARQKAREAHSSYKDDSANASKLALDRTLAFLRN
jgi:dienelactone hydrolase